MVKLNKTPSITVMFYEFDLKLSIPTAILREVVLLMTINPFKSHKMLDYCMDCISFLMSTRKFEIVLIFQINYRFSVSVQAFIHPARITRKITEDIRIAVKKMCTYTQNGKNKSQRENTNIQTELYTSLYTSIKQDPITDSENMLNIGREEFCEITTSEIQATI